MDHDYLSSSFCFGFCRLSPKPLEDDSAPSSRKNRPISPKEEPRSLPSLDLRTSRVTASWWVWGKRGPKGMEPSPSITWLFSLLTPCPGYSTALGPFFCPFWRLACGRKPAQELPARGVVETSGGREAGCSRRKMSLGTFAPPITLSTASVLTLHSAVDHAWADPLCWPTAVHAPKPSSWVTSPGKPSPGLAPLKTTPAETTPGGGEGARQQGWAGRDGSRQPWDHLLGDRGLGET